ncbi:MAG: hypothetical protein FWC32_11120 [Firmicutes bacterium]|nr:hypothetical protein [Bacillota bacterium]
MNTLSSWKLAEKLEASNKKGIIFGLVLALIIVAIVIAVIVKVQWLKKHFGCDECDMDFDDDFDLDFDDEDTIYTSESDFV